MKLAVGVLPLVALLGCSAKVLDLGGEYQDGGSGSDSGGQGSGSEGRPSALSGVYSGYIEGFMFSDGSDNLSFTLTFNDDGTVTGTVRFGAAPLLAPPTDPNVGYPPGYGDGPTGPQQSLEGFSYTVLSGTYVVAPRLQLHVDQNELWKQWCDLQTTIYPLYDGCDVPAPAASCASSGCGNLLGYSCLPNGATVFGTSCSVTPCTQTQPVPVDCGKFDLCGVRSLGTGTCMCTQTSCTVVVGSSIAFDTQLIAGGINGSVTGLMGGQVLNVHLTRMP